MSYAVVHRLLNMYAASIKGIEWKPPHYPLTLLALMHPRRAVGARTAFRGASAPNALVLPMSVAMFTCWTVGTSTAVG
jgi:hypothetical protein